MEIQWQSIAGTLAICLGAVGSLVAGVRWFLQQRKTITAPVVPVVSTRSADDGPPPGAVEWVVDIAAAMGVAPSQSILKALTDGCCRDKARARRIAQLESHEPQESAQ